MFFGVDSSPEGVVMFDPPEETEEVEEVGDLPPADPPILELLLDTLGVLACENSIGNWVLITFWIAAKALADACDEDSNEPLDADLDNLGAAAAAVM